MGNLSYMEHFHLVQALWGVVETCIDLELANQHNPVAAWQTALHQANAVARDLGKGKGLPNRLVAVHEACQEDVVAFAFLCQDQAK